MLLLSGLAAMPPSSPAGDQPEAEVFSARRVAHAGGAYRGLRYTNSYEALDANLELGFTYFEIDFVFTSDQRLVCLHDWKGNFERSFGAAEPGPVSHAEFERLVARNDRFRNCTLDGLADWMRDNPQAIVITDVRGDLGQALRQVSETLPAARNRVIPQIYQPGQYQLARKLGFEAVIWTLYRYQGTATEVAGIVSGWPGPVAIAMPIQRANTELPGLLGKLGVPSYVHTVNSPLVFQQLRRSGVTEIFTDTLAPGRE